MKAVFEWVGPTGKTLIKGTLHGDSTHALGTRTIEMALIKAGTHEPPVIKWNRLIVTIYNGG